MIYALVGKIVVCVGAFLLSYATVLYGFILPVYAKDRTPKARVQKIDYGKRDLPCPSVWTGQPCTHTPHWIRLLTADGDAVTRLDPESYFDEDGRLPSTIVWEGRTFVRGWTNEGNADADERLWFEVTR